MTGFVSPLHIAIFAAVLLLVFGSKRMPEMGRSLGKGMREFKDSVSGMHAEEPSAALTTGAPAPEHVAAPERETVA